MPLTPDQIADFTVATISNFKRLKWTDISLDHVEYISSTLIDDKKKEPFETFSVQLSNPTGGAVIVDQGKVMISIQDKY